MNKSIIGTAIIALIMTTLSVAQEARKPVIDKYGNHLIVHTNSSTDFSQRVYGQMPNISLLGIQREGLTKSSIQTLSSKLFFDYKDILKIDPNEVKLRKVDTDGQLWFVSYQQTVNDIPVLGTQIGYTVDQSGDIVALGTDTYQDIEVPKTPKVSKQAALQTAQNAFGADSSQILEPGTLTIYPMIEDSVITFYLTWKVHLSSRKQLKNWVYFVDATNGKIVEHLNYLAEQEISKDNTSVPKRSDKYISIKTDTTTSKSNTDILQVHTQQKLILNYNVNGTVTGDYFPEDYSDTPVSTNFEITGIKVYDSIGRPLDQGDSDSNGDYSINYTSSFSTHYIHIPLQNDWVKVTEKDQTIVNPINTEPIKQVHSYTPGSSVQVNADFGAGDASNVKYHVTLIHDYFKNSHNYNGMDYQMEAAINFGSGTNGSADGTKIMFGSQDGEKWAQASDVVYHEYTHNVIHHIYDGWTGGGVRTSIDEGIADYFASTLTNDPDHAESVGGTRTLDNNFSYDEFAFDPVHWNGQVIGGAAWDVREEVGSTIADKLVFKALQLTPQADTFDEFMQNMMNADQILYYGAHADEIIDAAQNHGITAPSFPAPSSPTNVTITNPTGFSNPNIDWDDNPEPYIGYYEVWRQKKRISDGIIFPETLLASSTSSSYTDTNLFMNPMQHIYEWRYAVKAVSTDSAASGLSGYTQWIDGISQHKQRPEITDATPEEFALQQNYPNPFNPSTQVKFALREQAEVSIQVYNIMGQQVATLTNKTMQAGFHQVEFDGSGLSSGVYIARMQAVGTSGKAFTDELKMQLIK
ncbi:T9SS type A sorting domain-containing protein [Gracilimonas sp.]|uniref:T9SS type A sorting domain-containing protein n=1 Tax=Gracilimonas sp. TaxID=1974203 RepID=UPI002871485C|nr:T9SS type A sorting domain-containing protein [Gracilimonas sp.]